MKKDDSIIYKSSDDLDEKLKKSQRQRAYIVVAYVIFSLGVLIIYYNINFVVGIIIFLFITLIFTIIIRLFEKVVLKKNKNEYLSYLQSMYGSISDQKMPKKEMLEGKVSTPNNVRKVNYFCFKVEKYACTFNKYDVQELKYIRTVPRRKSFYAYKIIRTVIEYRYNIDVNIPDAILKSCKFERITCDLKEERDIEISLEHGILIIKKDVRLGESPTKEIREAVEDVALFYEKLAIPLSQTDVKENLYYRDLSHEIDGDDDEVVTDSSAQRIYLDIIFIILCESFGFLLFGSLLSKPLLGIICSFIVLIFFFLSHFVDLRFYKVLVFAAVFLCGGIVEMSLSRGYFTKMDMRYLDTKIDNVIKDYCLESCEIQSRGNKYSFIDYAKYLVVDEEKNVIYKSGLTYDTFVISKGKAISDGQNIKYRYQTEGYPHGKVLCAKRDYGRNLQIESGLCDWSDWEDNS